MGETSKPSKKMNYAGRHRAQAHASAHADEQADVPAAMPDHPLVTHKPPQLISRTADLRQLIERLHIARSFAYDSEFIGELTYVPNLCLVQVASTSEVALIDPLADVDLTPFWELLCDESVEKIVHAGQQDIEPVVRHLDRAPRNVFDTQIAAGFIGLTYPVSLSKLVMELVGARLGKALTFSHWDQRPLSNQQLRYAADDVRYLPAVRQIIGKRLTELGHEDWARQECDALCEPSQYKFDPQGQYQRIRGAGSLPARGLAILRELTNWRDSLAQSHNVPPRTLAKDEVLIALARSPVKTVEKLSSVKGLPRPVEVAHATDIIAAIARGLSTDLAGIELAREPELSPSQKFVGDALWSTLQAYSAGQGIDPALVGSRHEITDLVRYLTNTEKSDTPPPILQGWRHEAVGKHLAELCQGKTKFELSWTDSSLRSRSI